MKIFIKSALILTFLSLSLMCYSQEIALRQKFDMTDLQWENLKGNVVETQTKRMDARLEYGEWVAHETDNREGNEYVIYGDLGNRLMAITWGHWRMDNLVFFNYTERGELISKEIYSYSSPNTDKWTWQIELDNHDVIKQKYGKDQYLAKCIYEYGTDGRLMRTITRNDSDVSSGGSRDILKYESDGDILLTEYNNSGTEIRRSMVSPDGQEALISKDGIYSAFKRNKEGKIVSSAYGVQAIGGRASGASYYGYNEHGDVCVISSSEAMAQDVKELPWLERKANVGTVYYYEYEYDSHGNWTTKKEFMYSSLNDQPRLSEWINRTITYSEDIGLSGEELLAKGLREKEEITNKREEKEREEAERERLYREHPYVTYDGSIALDIVNIVIPKLPKVKGLSGFLKGTSGTIDITFDVNAYGKVTRIFGLNGYTNRSERCQLIVSEVGKAIEQISENEKWVRGYNGKSFRVIVYYEANGDVSAVMGQPR